MQKKTNLRPQSVEKIDETRSEATHLSRADYHLAQKFRRYMIRWAGVDELRWKSLSILCLREINGWTMEMIGLVYGHPKGHVTRIVRDIKSELASGFLKHFADHRTDTYTALKTINVETALDRLKRLRHLLRKDDTDIDHAIEDMEDQLLKWHETN